MNSGALRDHLTSSGLAGAVATTPWNTVEKCRRLADADPRYTFGLFPPELPTLSEAVGAIASMCGDPHGILAAAATGAVPEGLQEPGWIDPDATLAGIETHRSRLARLAAQRGSVLFATGHPTGLIGHYAALARALDAAGCTVLTPYDDEPLPEGYEPDVTRAAARMRYIDRVACLRGGGELIHTHRPDGMHALLDVVGVPPETRGGMIGRQRIPMREHAAVDLVVADHGLAGAAIARGIDTLSIADVNDPGLPLAQLRGMTDGVLVIDDNLAPRVFAPVTEAVLAW